MAGATRDRLTGVHLETPGTPGTPEAHEISLGAADGRNQAGWRCAAHRTQGTVFGFADSATTARDAAWECARKQAAAALAGDGEGR